MEAYLAQPRYRGEDFDSASSDVADIVVSMGGLTVSEEWMGCGLGIR